MDILVVAGVIVAVILILVGLFLIFRRAPQPTAEKVVASEETPSPQIELPLDAVETDSAPTEPVISANDFITQTIHQHAAQHASQLHAEHVDKPQQVQGFDEDQPAVLATAHHAFKAPIQPEVSAEPVSPTITLEPESLAPQKGGLDAMLDDLEQATSLSPHSHHLDVGAPLHHTELELESAIPSISAIDTAELTEWQGDSILLDEHLADHSRSEEDSILVQAEQIIAIHLLPKSGRPLEGKMVLRLLRKHGLRFGEMSLFHRFEEATGQGPMMFSVLKYTQEGPAGFDLDTMENENFDGLSFFLALPGIRPLQGFDMMMSTAQRLCLDCYSQLFDEEMNQLSEQLKGHYRHQVLDFRPTRL
ncbi:cell division protein ZipA C-terminal FtsZ-binding domain-containing protein [Aquirhabdus parva]|uniref:Cell division protein ZipA n=1 Tax=Aquirhabdus parva TaxID=2283318 RepID=A0A345P453_9GAMM|nr:cell division protein ZipA C-terminal FtsZ-binding domain-containing protein [Aquirhabdus parva]AXI02062.1 hypothetical protein HYN46_03815 [Aquirhabdus parva]